MASPILHDHADDMRGTPPRGDGAPHPRRRLHLIIGAALAVVLLTAGAAIVYRVLAPAEELNRTNGRYPQLVTVPARVIGTLPSVPLIVDGRLRVYVAKRQVRADLPANARTARSPYWSYRRWPQQLVGVVAVGTTVVSRWSDGKLVALDARTGRIAWRADAPVGPDHYTGRSTGAQTVYTPEGLFSAHAADGHPVVVVAATGTVAGYDTTTGKQLWQVATPNGSGTCLTEGFTGPGTFVAVDSCATHSTLLRYDVLTGQRLPDWTPAGQGAQWDLVPLGCAVGRSQCRALRTLDGDQTRGWLFGDDPAGQPVAAPALDPESSWLVDETAVVQQPGQEGELVGRSLLTSQELWRWTAQPASGAIVLVAGEPGAVHLLTAEHELFTLDPATGALESHFDLAGGKNAWHVGYAYAEDRFVVIERLARRAKPDDPDTKYYYSAQTVALSGS
jgi:outer membrane protein assembly factor BamB